MAAPTLPKLKTIRLTKLQALLLLGGAFVLAAAWWVCTQYRLVSEPVWSRGPFRDAQAGIVLYGDSDGTKKFARLLADSASNTPNLGALAPDSSVYFYADSATGSLHLQVGGRNDRESNAYPSRLRLIPKGVQALGFVNLDGRKQPFSASFDDEKAVFNVGRSYRGLIGDSPVLNSGRRMKVSLNQQALYLEKPEGVSWQGVTSLLSPEMQRFPALSAFWTLPGRVEMSVSASHTDSVLQPFSLYYRPAASASVPKNTIETYVKELLADALPHAIEIQLPDGSHMQELRHDMAGVQVQEQQNQFGAVVKFSYPAEKAALYAFFDKTGEAWVTTDLSLVQAVMLGNIDAATPKDACNKGGQGGFAIVPGSSFPLPIGFKTLAVTIHSLETGMFTTCGYY